MEEDREEKIDEERSRRKGGGREWGEGKRWYREEGERGGRERREREEGERGGEEDEKVRE